MAQVWTCVVLSIAVFSVIMHVSDVSPLKDKGLDIILSEKIFLTTKGKKVRHITTEGKKVIY